MPFIIVDEAIQAINAELFKGIDSSEHDMIPAVVQQKMANGLKTTMGNASAGNNGPLSDVTNECGSYRMERSGVTSNVLAPAHGSNVGEVQDDTTAPLTGNWAFDKFNPAAQPRRRYVWCTICEKWQSNRTQHNRWHAKEDPVLCSEPLLGDAQGMLCLEQFQDSISLRSHIQRDHGRYVGPGWKGIIQMNSPEGQALLNGDSENRAPLTDK